MHTRAYPYKPVRTYRRKLVQTPRSCDWREMGTRPDSVLVQELMGTFFSLALLLKHATNNGSVVRPWPGGGATLKQITRRKHKIIQEHYLKGQEGRSVVSKRAIAF